MGLLSKQPAASYGSTVLLRAGPSLKGDHLHREQLRRLTTTELLQRFSSIHVRWPFSSLENCPTRKSLKTVQIHAKHLVTKIVPPYEKILPRLSYHLHGPLSRIIQVLRGLPGFFRKANVKQLYRGLFYFF